MDDLGVFSGFMVYVLLGIAGSILAAAGSRGSGQRFQVKLFWIAYLLRSAFSILIYGFGLIRLLRDEDGSGWVIGVACQHHWESLGYGMFDLPSMLIEMFSAQNKGYFFLLGFLFSVVEPGRLSAAALNCFLGSTMIVYAYRLATNLFNAEVARRAGYWLCFFPSMVIWSAQTIKEPVIILLEVLVVYGCVQIRYAGFSIRHLVLTLCGIVVLIPFRFYAAYLGAAAVVAGFIFPSTGRGGIRIGPIVAGGLLAFFLVSSGLLAGRDSGIEKLDLAYLQKMKKDGMTNIEGAGAGSSVAMDYDLQTSTGMGLSLVVGAAHLLLAPFPWQLATGSVRMILVAPEMIFWWWLFCAGFLPGMAYTLRHNFNKNLPIFLMLIGFGLLYSLTFYNVGLVYRQRAQLMPWLLIISSVGIEQRKIRKALRASRLRESAVNNDTLLLGPDHQTGGTQVLPPRNWV